METTRLLAIAGGALAAIFFQTASAHLNAEVQIPSALSGQVTSAEEGPMEGVVISAKKDGSTINISVVTNASGRFAFPAARLEPGHYALKARAAGYELDAACAADVASGQEAKADIKLKKVKNLSAHLTNAEWLSSMPGTDQQKRFLLNCVGCHTLERIMKSTHDTDAFLEVIQRMGLYYPGSTPLKPQRLIGTATRDVERGGSGRKSAEWLASVNLSAQQNWDFPLKTQPRLTGKSTHVIITEYDLPNPLIQPHDVVLDRAGNVWYSDFGQMFLGKMDPKTGKVTQYPIPVVKPGSPEGTLDLEFDADDNPWIGVMYQSAIAKFDKKTEKFQFWQTPKAWDTDGGQLGHLAIDGTPADNKVWIKNSDVGNIYRLDLVSNKFENLGNFKDPQTGKRIGTYGLHSDAQNNVYLLDFSAGNIVKIDAKTKEASVYRTPTPDSRPRRGRVDREGRLWFGEYQGDAIGMFDPKTEKMTEWKVPTPWSAPYDAVLDRNGDAWTGSMLTDRVARLDTKSGQYTEYMLPRTTNIRRVYVDDSKNPGTLWIGSNHGASIVKVEPLE
ncbi:MAG TPA: carboxypeptidase regulatory-like domain-containing protein [Bryobacteraceae bacterium]|nr:carboxypeptidase regulatory-like domain-containing protein [Bryobacteraceae bacterium]